MAEGITHQLSFNPPLGKVVAMQWIQEVSMQVSAVQREELIGLVEGSLSFQV